MFCHISVLVVNPLSPPLQPITLLLLLLICFTVYISAAFIERFYAYIAVMSVCLPETNFSISLLTQ